VPKVDDCKPRLPPQRCIPKCGPLPDGVYQNARIVVECGCITDIKPGEPFVLKPEPCCSTSGQGGSSGSGVNTVATPTINFFGDGDTNPLSANVRVSPDSGNILTVRPNGVFAAEPTIQATVAIDTTSPSVTLSGNGTTTYPLRAVARLDPAVDNALKNTPAGLRVDPVSVRFSSNAANIIKNGSDGNPGAFIEKEAIWESVDPVWLTGLGTDLQKLGARLTLSGDPLNALTRRFALDAQNRPIAGLYAKQETSVLQIVGGVGVNNADLVAGMTKNIETGVTIWIGRARGTVSAGPSQLRPTVTVTGPTSNLSISTSSAMYGTSTGSIAANSITSTGTVTNMTPFTVDIPLPGGYVWRDAIASAVDAPSAYVSVVQTMIIGGNTARIVGHWWSTSAPSGNMQFMLVLRGYDSNFGEFGP